MIDMVPFTYFFSRVIGNFYAWVHVLFVFMFVCRGVHIQHECIGLCEHGYTCICVCMYFDRGQPWVSFLGTLFMCFLRQVLIGCYLSIRPGEPPRETPVCFLTPGLQIWPFRPGDTQKLEIELRFPGLQDKHFIS